MKNTIFFIILSLFSAFTYAGGVAVGATRVIYHATDNEAALVISNTDDKDMYLVQSWVDDLDHKKTRQFIVTPPLFKINPGSRNQVRVLKAPGDLPKDRESVFWLNVKSIPAIDSSSLQKNTLQLAIKTVIKLFYRPDNLPVDAKNATKKVSWKKVSGGLQATNDSPYYITIVEVEFGGVKSKTPFMIPPFSKHTFKGQFPSRSQKDLSYGNINDYGGVSKNNYKLN